MKRVSVFAIIILLGVSCADIFLEKDPESTPENNFEIFWNDYNQYYSFFELKKLNWDSIYQVKRIQISPETTEAQLTSIFNDMIQYLRDGHAYLRTSKTKYYYYDFWSKYPVNKLQPGLARIALQAESSQPGLGVKIVPINIDYSSSFATLGCNVRIRIGSPLQVADYYTKTESVKRSAARLTADLQEALRMLQVGYDSPNPKLLAGSV